MASAVGFEPTTERLTAAGLAVGREDKNGRLRPLSQSPTHPAGSVVACGDTITIADPLATSRSCYNAHEERGGRREHEDREDDDQDAVAGPVRGDQ